MRTETGDRITDRAGFVRVTLVLLALPQLVSASWAYFAPRSWHETFPGFGRVWVAGTGPFNEHATKDVGLGLGALAILVLIAAWRMERGLVRASLVAWLVFHVPHFIYHAMTTETLDAVDNVLNLGTLAVAIALPVALLIITRVGSPNVDRKGAVDGADRAGSNP